MKITMIGTSHVGLVSSARFADFGHDMICGERMLRKWAPDADLTLSRIGSRT